MPEIHLLSQETIDKIAAGEVIERPSSVVKELVENSIDAGSTAITVEIRDGGTTFIRITDNGCGIEKSQVDLAFLRHSTSKIKSVEDLLSVSSLGFRGEALSSIAAVSQVELISKTAKDLTGIRYVLEGSKEISKEEIGAPNGTTFLVKNLFYNTPARRKFLKSNQTEGTYISTMMERLAFSHPEISFKFIVNGQVKMQTSGNSSSKDIIYQVFGRDITANIMELSGECELYKVHGFIGKPIVSRGNRNYENYYINKRYIKSNVIARAIEDAYKSFLMQHQYPFCVLYFEFDGELLDINVHPTKMELRFSQGDLIYKHLYQMIRERLMAQDHIVAVPVTDRAPKLEKVKVEAIPEPFEVKRLEKIKQQIRKDSPYERKYEQRSEIKRPLGKPFVYQKKPDQEVEKIFEKPLENSSLPEKQTVPVTTPPVNDTISYVQEELSYGEKFLSADAKKNHRIIGQLFDTYWLIEFDHKLFIIDQHAAHEKVLYERMVKQLKTKEFTSQLVSPPIILSLNAQEAETLEKIQTELEVFGFKVESFGGKEYSVSAVPDNLFSLDPRQILIDLLDEADAINTAQPSELILEKIASMSCKAAVKGNSRLSRPEIETLIDELLELENPYFCPHGRPTIISMTKYEIEKKFKRIV